ncbi:hypothetical protein TorRG33x02_132350 [Trema orientale]|uniref:Uncharacterized protein n=1 Tax=Trema orientale TaxID=63057 RepID=A0A2P5EZQ0_TREOI|nr:hypothetical protein TorRG33x02_132350 [Trema orientale]
MMALRHQNNSQVDEIISRPQADCTGDLSTCLHGGPIAGVEAEQSESTQSRGSGGTYATEV